jgi:hypothetical protein
VEARAGRRSVYVSTSVATTSRARVATARYRAMLVAIDQMTSARTPGKPKPNTLSSPVRVDEAAHADRPYAVTFLGRATSLPPLGR